MKSLKNKSKDELIKEIETLKKQNERKQEAEKIRESEATYRTLAKNFPNGAVVLFDHDLRYKIAEGVGLKEAGLDGKKMEGKTLWEVFPKETCNAVEPDYRSALNGKYVKNEVAYADRIYRTQAVPVFDDQEKVVAGMMVTQDITSEKIAEQTLIEEEAKLSNIFNAVDEGIFYVDKSGKILETNHAVSKIINIPRQKIVGKNALTLIKQFLKGSDVVRLLKIVSKVLSGKSQAPFELNFRKKILEISAKYDRKTQKIIGVMRDVTTACKTKLELDHERKQLKSILRVAPTGIGMVKERKIQFVNQQFAKMIGYPKSELSGHSSRKLYPSKAEFDRVGKFKYEQIKKHGTGTIETQFLRKDGKLIDVLLSSTPFDLNDINKGVTITALDITERKQAEKMLESTLKTADDIVKTIPSGLFIYEYKKPNKLYLLQGNPAAEQLTGIKIEKMIGKEFNQIWPEAKKQGITKAFLSVVKTGKMYSTEELVYQDKKLEGAFRIRVFKLPEDRLAVSFENITESKLAEQQLQESETKYRMLFETMAQGVVYQNARGEITSANPAAQNILGQSLAQMQGRTSMDPRWKAVDENKKELPGNKHPAMLALKSGEAINNFIQGIFNPQKNEYVWIIVNSIPQFKENGKKPNEVFSTFLDITPRKQAEEEFKAYASFLDTIMDQSPFAMWISDKTGTVIRTNQSLQKTINLKNDQIVGKYNVLKDQNLIDQGVMPQVEAVFHKKKMARFVIPWQAANAGKVDFQGARNLWIDVAMFPIVNEKGDLQNVVCQWIDITEQKVAEDNLRELSERNEALLEAIPDIVVEVDNNKIYTWANTAGYQFFGEDVIGKEAAEYFVGEQDIYQKVKSLFQGAEDIAYIESWQRRQDGQKRLLAWWSKGLKDHDGKVTGILSSARDITDQRQAEDELQESKRLLETTGKLAQVGGWEVDAETQEVRWTEETYRIHDVPFGYKPPIDEAINFFHPDEREKLTRSIQRAVKDGEPYDMELRFITAKGKHLWTRTICTPEIVDGKVRKLYGAFQDITKRKNMEEELKKYRDHLQELVNKKTFQLEQSNKELKDFAYIVSHDLKAPLRAINQLAYWLANDYKDVFDEDGSEQLALLQTRVKRMDTLIDGILQYSRVGKVREKEEKIDFKILVTDIISSLGVPENIKISVAKKLPKYMGDKTRFTQLFQNLVSNSIKFMDKPNGKIEIGCADQGKYWKFWVKDNGTGIEKKYFDKVFQIFQTLKSRDEQEGTGVGLTLVKKIVTIYKGEVWLESELGEGTTVFFTLPKQE